MTDGKRFSYYDASTEATTKDLSHGMHDGMELAPLTGANTNGDSSDNRPVDQTKIVVGEKPKSSPAPYSYKSNDSNLDMILGNSPAPDCLTCFAFIAAYITYTCQYAPRFCWFISIIALVVPTYLLVVGVIANPTERFGIVEHDFTSVKSMYDFAVKDIDHWCLKGDNDSCQCEDPLQPSPRSEMRAWTTAHIGNIKQINALMEEDLTRPDIAFMGGSIVEKMDGKWYGLKNDKRLENIAKEFNKHFSNLDGGDAGGDSLTGVALGIAGDMNPSVLWRLINGEMPDDFDPKIWWLELGMNDLGRAQCSEEVVVMGILRVVEEIISRRPDSTIVINSLFPMAELRGNPNGKAMGLEESFGGKQPRNNKSKNKNGRERHRIGARRVEESGAYRSLKKNVVHVSGQKHVTMSNQQTQHKFNPVTHRENRIPIWTSLTAVNRELAKFAKNNDNVVYFDVARFFTERDGKNTILNTDLITMTGIPTEAGYKMWEAAVASKAHELLEGG